MWRAVSPHRECNDANYVSATPFLFSIFNTQIHLLHPGWFWRKWVASENPGDVGAVRTAAMWKGAAKPREEWENQLFRLHPFRSWMFLYFWQQLTLWNSTHTGWSFYFIRCTCFSYWDKPPLLRAIASVYFQTFFFFFFLTEFVWFS